MKRILVIVAAILALGALGFWVFRPTTPAAPKERQIVVGLIGGGWAERIERLVTPTMTKNGIKVVYVTGTAHEWVARLVAARGQKPPVDVFEADDQTIGKLRAAGLAIPLQLDRIPNHTQLSSGMYGDDHVAYWASQPAILYNVDALKKAGITPPKRYSDLERPEFRGRVILPDINTYHGFYMVLGLAYENGGSEDNIQPGFDALARIRPHSYAITSDTVGQLFNAGDITVAVWPAHMANHYNDAGLPIAVVHPQVAGHPVSIARGYFAVASGSKDPEAVALFLNTVISAEVQKGVYDEGYILPTNAEALRHVYETRDEAKNKTGLNRSSFQKLDPEDVAKAWVPNLARIDYPDWTKRWQTAVDRQSQK